MLISQTKIIAFPCIWFTGPHESERFLYGYGVTRRLWLFRFTPFWPDSSSYIPGGILDSEGKYYEFKSLIGWFPKPVWLPMTLEWVFNIRRLFVRFDVEVSSPVQLDMEAFKDWVIKITEYKLRPERKSKLARKAQAHFYAAKNFQEIVEFLHWYQMSDGGLVDRPYNVSSHR